ncbi:MAG TPA: helix-turn-helix transcriptional regulator [Sphingomicrobium sp.]|nr:helix-turn-helix transcriptional regulator [Sphingomicrobium sp.]
MGRERKLSPQTADLLKTFLSRPADWRYGYNLSKELGLRSGTLYPILIRLTDQGFLESEWRPAERTGRPPRHAYRLTQNGMSFAHAALVSAGHGSTRPRQATA